MNAEVIQLAGKLIASNYASHASQALSRVESLIKSLLSQRRIPDDGWSDTQLEFFMHTLAQMDTNNHVGNVGVGEREGRVWSPLVRQRHFAMTHGIGRSGDITANQPKAAGSSLLYAITNAIALDVLKMSGARATKQALVLPCATGSALALVLQALKAAVSDWYPDPKDSSSTSPTEDPPTPPQEPLDRRFVVWSRIDQKTCLKCILAAGLTPIVVELVQDGPSLRTDVGTIERHVMERGAGAICCVMTTTSCFAPRCPDDILAVARLCRRLRVPHIVNNAYGVQSAAIMKAVNSAMEHGRVDCYVQSTDKNFLVPIGGSIVASPVAHIITALAATYPGRASASPITDLFLTLMGMGRHTYRALLHSRQELLDYFQAQLCSFAEQHGEVALLDPRNDISLAVTLDRLPAEAITLLGSNLYYKGVSGPRAVSKGQRSSVCGVPFEGYGAHCGAFPHHYLAMACAIGLRRDEIDSFFKRLHKAYSSLVRSSSRSQQVSSPPPEAPMEEMPESRFPDNGPEKVVTEEDCVTEVWKICDSTMTEAAKAVSRHPDKDFVVVSSGRQRQGRGTAGRAWLSPEGNVYMTIAVRKSRLISSREVLLPLEVALVTLQSIHTAAPMVQGAQLKWPNDVVIDGKKVSGCLVEEADDFRLIGIGINVEVAPSVADGGRESCCLCDHGMPPGGATYLSHVVARTLRHRLAAHQAGTRQQLIEEWRRFAAWDLVMHTRDATREAVKAVDITEHGQLVVERMRDRARDTLIADYLD